MHSIRKAVIPAAGFGTRMLPAAKAIPKEMLPVLDQPVIQYVVEEAVDAGLDDVLLVVSRGKQALQDHFNRNPELEERLKASGRESLLAAIERLRAKAKVHSILQPAQRGLGDAVLQARAYVGDEPFVGLLADTIFSGDSPARQLIDAYRQFGTSVIGLEEVAPEKVSRYGIVGGEPLGDGIFRLDTLIEKPRPEQAPSRLAIAARYVLTPAIFDCIAQTGAGAAGEVQLTDALKLLLAREPIHGVILRGRRHDVGNPIDWLKTNLLFAARDPQTWDAIAPLARELSTR